MLSSVPQSSVKPTGVSRNSDGSVKYQSFQNDLGSTFIEVNFENDTFEDFEFNFRNCNTFYEWVKHLKFTDTSIWVDQEWKKLSLTENELIVNFTAAWTPPIIEIMLGSKLYPDLKFRLTYADISDGFEKGTIEGSNGRFNESKK